MWSICILSIKQYEKVRLLQCFAMQKNTKITKFKSQLTFTDKKPKLKAFSYPEEKIVPVIGILHGDNKHQKANTKLIEEALKQGFKPKWYCVFHFNDGGSSKRQQFRRTQFDDVEQDLEKVQDALYTEMYNNKWKQTKRRARSIWSIEYGDNPDKPHINLIIEKPPYPYDPYRSFYVLLDRFLPTKCKCLSTFKDHSHVQPIFEENGILSYISKESDFRNATLCYRLNDYKIAHLPI